MALSADAVKRLMIATASQAAGTEIGSAIDNATAKLAAIEKQGFFIAAAIVCTHNDATTDFGALAVGDLVIHLADDATSVTALGFTTSITAGTLAESGVVDDLYVAIRAYTKPTVVARTDNF